MDRDVRFFLVLAGNIAAALSALVSLGAYSCSLRDPGGKQYLLLEPAAWLAGLALGLGCLLALLSLRRPVAWANPALAAVAFLVARLPEVIGLGYRGAILDLLGVVLAAMLLLLAAAVTVVVIRGLGPLVP